MLFTDVHLINADRNLSLQTVTPTKIKVQRQNKTVRKYEIDKTKVEMLKYDF